MNKRKLLPTTIMLLAGSVFSITLTLMKYDLKSLLSILLAVLIGFYIIGLLIKKMLDYFDEKNHVEPEMEFEGEVIEKENSSNLEEEPYDPENYEV